MSDPAENRDVRGNTIKPHSVEAENVNAKNATVESEPSEANEIARKVDIDAKADLDSTTGVLKSSQVPDLAITSVSTVPDQSSRLSLSVEEGDVAIQTDTDTTYIFTGGDPSVNSNWSEIVLDVLDAISGSTISPDTVNANSVNTDDRTVENLGAEAFLSSNQTLSTPGEKDQLTLDTVVVDDRGDFDAANNEFVVSTAGDYRISGVVTAAFSGSDLRLNVQVNGSNKGRFRNRLDGFLPSLQFDKTLRDLSANDTISVAVTQYTGSSADIVGGDNKTFAELYFQG